MIHVQNDVPLPPPRRGNGGWLKYPWRSMAPGDSFVFPARETLRRTMEAATCAAATRKRHHGESYAVRKINENGVDVVRVWRRENGA